jgi:hypothetical protein
MKFENGQKVICINSISINHGKFSNGQVYILTEPREIQKNPSLFSYYITDDVGEKIFFIEDAVPVYFRQC